MEPEAVLTAMRHENEPLVYTAGCGIPFTGIRGHVARAWLLACGAMVAIPDSARSLLLYLAVQGTERITEGGGPQLLQELAHVYLGPNVKLPAFDNPRPSRIVHITAERIAGVGPGGTRKLTRARVSRHPPAGGAP